MSGLLTHSPAEILGQALLDLGELVDQADWSLGQWALAVDVEPDTPDDAVIFKDTQGIERWASQLTGERERQHGVQLLIRSRTSNAGRAKANVLQNLMEKEIFGMNVTVGSSTYRLHCLATVGDVLPLGFEEGSNRFLHSLNVTAVMWQLS